MAVIAAVAVGLGAGVLSGWGVGGGTVLLLYLTQLAGAEPAVAGRINLLFFLAGGLPALIRYRRAGLIQRPLWLMAVSGGLPGAVLGVLLAGALPTAWLRKGFGLLLFFLGIRELTARAPRDPKSPA